MKAFLGSKQVTLRGREVAQGKGRDAAKDSSEGRLIAGGDGCAYYRRESHSSLSLLFHIEEDAGTATGRRTLGLAAAHRNRSRKGR